MRYKNTPYLNDYEAGTRRWHIKRTEQLNEDYERLEAMDENENTLNDCLTLLAKRVEALEKRDHNPTPEGYWWCPVHGKVTREHNCEGFYHDVPVNEFGVTEPCWEELEHRTDEKEFNMADHRHFIDGGDSTDEHTSTPIVLGRTTEHRKLIDDRAIADRARAMLAREDESYGVGRGLLQHIVGGE